MKKAFASEMVQELLRLDRELVALTRRMSEELADEELRRHKTNVARVVVSLSKALDDVVTEFPELRPPGKDP